MDGWKLDKTLVAPRYRLYNGEVEIYFHAEYRYGTYFKIKSVSYNGKTYTASRYHYKFIPVVREAVFEILKTDGLYDYGLNKFVGYVNAKKEILGG